MNWKVFSLVFLPIPALFVYAWAWMELEEWLEPRVGFEWAVIIPASAMVLIAALECGFIIKGFA